MLFPRFLTNSDLNEHLHSVHIKSRHLVCRYEGCDSAYDDSASRSNHERSKHGETYPRAAEKGLVPPIQREKTPFRKSMPAIPMPPTFDG